MKNWSFYFAEETVKICIEIADSKKETTHIKSIDCATYGQRCAKLYFHCDVRRWRLYICRIIKYHRWTNLKREKEISRCNQYYIEWFTTLLMIKFDSFDQKKRKYKMHSSVISFFLTFNIHKLWKVIYDIKHCARLSIRLKMIIHLDKINKYADNWLIRTDLLC